MSSTGSSLLRSPTKDLKTGTTGSRRPLTLVRLTDWVWPFGENRGGCGLLPISRVEQSCSVWSCILNSGAVPLSTEEVLDRPPPKPRVATCHHNMELIWYL